ncbi:MAG: DUF2905 domain-containing protein [Pseudomonadota bacterium]
MNKILIYIGIFIVVIGVLWPLLTKLPIGKLPGDIIVKKEGIQLYFPITTMLIVSLVISLLLWLLKK